MSKVIPLSQGYEAIVDDSDYARVAKFRWMYNNGYASRWVKDGTKWKRVYLHRFISEVGVSEQCDHRNRNRLDERRCNLRTASRSQNRANAKMKVDSKTGFKGVQRIVDKRDPKSKPYWRARIMIDHDRSDLGCFQSPEEAARAYDIAALAKFGEFAATNRSLGLLA